MQKLYLSSDFEENFSVVSLSPRPRGRPRSSGAFESQLPALYDGPCMISNAKWKDIKSIMHLIPADAKNFYRSLNSSKDVDDTLSDSGDDAQSDVE